MLFNLAKIVSNFTYPSGIVVVLLLVTLALFRRPRLARILLIVSVALLWVFSTRMFSEWTLRGLEDRIPSYTVDAAPQEPVIIVLGGFLRAPNELHKFPELDHAGDRLLHGFRLYHAGKAPLILITSGDIPAFGKGSETESEAARSVLELWGVPESAILVETRSRTTRENAVFTRDLLAARGIHRGLLVTSAAHMPRAAGCFRKIGFEVSPSAADYQTGWPERDLIFRIIPDPDGMYDTAGAFHEYFGLWAYRLRGWV